MSKLDDTQNWVTLRATHQVVCAECETLISCLEQERDALRAEVEKLKAFDWQNKMIDLTAERDKLQAELPEARQAMRGWDAAAREDKATINRLRKIGGKMAEALRNLHDACRHIDEEKFDDAMKKTLDVLALWQNEGKQ